MTTKTKKTPQKEYNLDDLFKKVSDSAKIIHQLELDVAGMAKELIKISKMSIKMSNEHSEKYSLLERIKDRMGL